VRPQSVIRRVHYKPSNIKFSSVFVYKLPCNFLPGEDETQMLYHITNHIVSRLNDKDNKDNNTTNSTVYTKQSAHSIIEMHRNYLKKLKMKIKQRSTKLTECYYYHYNCYYLLHMAVAGKIPVSASHHQFSGHYVCNHCNITETVAAITMNFSQQSGNGSRIMTLILQVAAPCKGHKARFTASGTWHYY